MACPSSAFRHRERGVAELATLADYIHALGGELKVIADFGDPGAASLDHQVIRANCWPGLLASTTSALRPNERRAARPRPGTVTEYESEHGRSRGRAREFLIETGLIDDEPSGPPGNACHRLRHRRAAGRRTTQP